MLENRHCTRGASARTLITTFCLLAAPAMAGAEEAAPAGNVEPGSVASATTEATPINNGKIGLSLGSDFTTAYFFRGILQERDGFIWQPYGGIAFKLYSGDGFIKSFDFNLGSWNSVQSNQTFSSGSGPANWYESDILVGFTAGMTDYLSTNLTYAAYTFPNGAFSVAQELIASLTFNDSEFLGAFAIQPNMTWAFEVDNTAFGDQEGIYLQLGGKPSYTLFSDAEYPVTLALPLTLGLSVSDYYEVPGGDNDTFGYFDVGLVASIPLAFIPSDYGAWSASASVDMLALSGTLADANRGDGTFFVGKAGIGFAY